MSEPVEERVVIVTGAGRGIGRAEALEFARQGAKVVVNDLAGDDDPAGAVVDEIRSHGGVAVANHDDVSTWDGGRQLIGTALSEFGRLDVLVNNAGILRDRMFVSMTEREWDEVIAVHLRGTFVTSRHAAGHWRELSKSGKAVDGRIINTSSSSGLYGNVGQSNYGAAKGAIASLTIVLAEELARYGVTVNAIAPAALTRMTEALRERTDAEKAEMDPANIAPLVAWLGSPASRAVTGQIFNIKGSRISVAEGWVAGPEADNGTRWTQERLDELMPGLVAKARGRSDMDGHPIPR
ncbi:SDR family NAD(P)-dependent oxidoreductase [Amycolatopsis acidicola]|uniref:SDR family NAD(P)-dependent oxidoreductase n=1 Tax=Amycolatopsis acidicola TaxID=2596893 RepID=A0A5N0VK01_9PSEU|nr:SDR family oxidoreductase [Amycolatopsis acidicola]KAA9166018.1 SDR family NAD(P)-dependent oxidoreductase [Amycolatopsis acidicola]